METKDVLLELRKKNHLSQEEMADRLFVTRQAVSRWECGITVPNSNTLKLISKEFGVSINTLLGQPMKLFCQSCGMPLDDDGAISKELDGSMNENFCKWCYADGQYTHECTMEEMIEEILPHMHWPNPDEARKFLKDQLPLLERWK